MRKMSTTKVLLLASASPVALFGAGVANAADMAVKARPIIAPPPAYSWTGCYVGGQVGWGWGQQHYNSQRFEDEPSFGDIEDHGDSQRLNSSGGLFGGQLGCNYQFSGNWVVGLQGDIAAADINGKSNNNVDNNGDPINNIDFAGEGNSIAMKTQWLASVTAKLGVAGMGTNGLVNGTLYYIKGGVAWDQNQWDLTNSKEPFSSEGFYGQPITTEHRTGWTAGIGAETVLWSPNWTGFVEFNYYDFGHGKNINVSCVFPHCAGDDFNVFSTGRQDIETVKIGVNYKWY
jgi:outer membrane immunogenic protein